VRALNRRRLLIGSAAGLTTSYAVAMTSEHADVGRSGPYTHHTMRATSQSPNPALIRIPRAQDLSMPSPSGATQFSTLLHLTIA
jgi:hypothetical protein